jgi:hypothetical protein
MTDFNPLKSNIKDIILGAQSVVERNDLCQFEKIEFVESVFELFPSGSLVVRDTSDVVSKIKNGNITKITITYQNNTKETFFITGTSYLGNASSSTEENFVCINFSNELFKISQNVSVSELLPYNTAKVYDIKVLFDEIASGLSRRVSSGYFPVTVSTNEPSFSNVVVYKPANPMDGKIDIASENPIQYLNYISSLACKSGNDQPRYLMWTGFNNEIYFRYFYPNVENDPNYGSIRNYGVYEADVPTAKVNGSTYKKIYLLTTSPADQYLNRQYYYIRKVPKILNDNVLNTEAQNVELLFNHQYLDDGKRYDIEFITENGVVNTLPANTGISSIDCNDHWGYYTKNDVANNFANSSLLSMDYGNKTIYSGKSFMGSSSFYPFVDTPEMWKNMFDMTPVHPNVGTSTTGTIVPATCNLQKVFTIRKNTVAQETKSNQLKDIEKQNFILYVLCCVNTEEQVEPQEETFFACITGWTPDGTVTGYHDEPLVYRYSWKRLAVSLSTNLNNFSNFSAPENTSRWQYTNESSDSQDITTYAINLNERKNDRGNYYAPGWYAQNLTEQLFQEVNYRPIGNWVGPLLSNVPEGDNYCYHIVKMTKVPYIKIIKQAINYNNIVTDFETLDTLIENSKDRFVYYFEMANITDGPCTINTQP